MNHKKLRRLYREERLAVRRRGGRKRALGTRAPMALPQGPNLPPAIYAKLSAPVKQRDGALRYVEGSAPRPVASPSHQGSNDARTLLISG